MAARWWDVALHAAVGVATTLAFLLWENPAVSLLAGGVLLFVTNLYLAVQEARRAPLMLSPLSFYFIWYSVALGLAAIYMGVWVRNGDWVPLSVAYLPPKDVAYAYVLFVWGSVMLHAGLQTTRPLRWASTTAAPPRRPEALLRAIILLWAVGLVTLWKPSLAVSLGAPGRILQWSGYAALALLTLTPREHLRLSRTAFVSLVAVGTAALFGVSLMSGSKAYLMYCFVPLGWLFILRPQLRRWIPPSAVLLVAFYLGIVAPVVTVSRFTELDPGETYAARLVTTFERYVDHLQGSSGTFAEIRMNDYGEGLLYRTFDTLPLAYLVEEVRGNGFQDGATMSYAAYALIPRVLWPEKPSVTRGGWFAYYIGFAESPEESTMALGVTAVGELYWNFGVLGVVVGMFGIGVMLGYLWRMAGADPRREPLKMLLYVMVMLNTPNMAEAVTVLLFIISAFVVFKAALILKQVLLLTSRRSHVSIPA